MGKEEDRSKPRLFPTQKRLWAWFVLPASLRPVGHVGSEKKMVQSQTLPSAGGHFLLNACTVPVLPAMCSAEQSLQRFTAVQVLGPPGNSRRYGARTPHY